ncbi:tight adherence protein D [Vibrio crassostreae]|uniref:tetratricopeptide repeat protein n=1 Tax=Vibrio crassostreae TaxID=246167 RepID=UPI0010428C83|nr:secretion protein [Vibrio crassostreae]TCV58047.1 tight adherence protein D [Vibrio crassostreae]
MFKQFLICMLPLWLMACSSTANNWQQEESKEAIYQQTNNHTKLVALYKVQLQREDIAEIRQKLASSYLKLADAESALFYITPVIESEKASLEAYQIQAQAYGDMDQYPAAIAAAKLALELDPSNSRTENLLGTYYGYSFQTMLARRYFERARDHFYDGVTVNNNLAVLDIAEGDYLTAAKRLMPLYKSHQADEMVMANLTLSMAKQGHYAFVQQVLSDTYSQHQIEKIYRSLQKFEPMSADSRLDTLSSIQYEK